MRNFTPCFSNSVKYGVMGRLGRFALPLKEALQPSAAATGSINLKVDPLSRQSISAFFAGAEMLKNLQWPLV